MTNSTFEARCEKEIENVEIFEWNREFLYRCLHIDCYSIDNVKLILDRKKRHEVGKLG